MAATAVLSLSGTISGFGGAIAFELAKAYTSVDVPDIALCYQKSTVHATNWEVLDIGAVGTVKGILIHPITEGLDIDTSFVDTEAEELTVIEGECALFCPSGVVKIRADDGTICDFEVLIWGTVA